MMQKKCWKQIKGMMQKSCVKPLSIVESMSMSKKIKNKGCNMLA